MQELFHRLNGDLADVGKDYDDLRQQAAEMITLILAATPDH